MITPSWQQVVFAGLLTISCLSCNSESNRSSVNGRPSGPTPTEVEQKTPIIFDLLSDASNLKEAPKIRLDGKELNVTRRVLDAFAADVEIPAEKKDLEKYTLELWETENYYLASLLVRRDPEKSYVGGETEEGVDVLYIINKMDGTLKRNFRK